MARTNTLNSKSNRGKTALTVLFAAVALRCLFAFRRDGRSSALAGWALASAAAWPCC